MKNQKGRLAIDGGATINENAPARDCSLTTGDEREGLPKDLNCNVKRKEREGRRGKELVYIRGVAKDRVSDFPIDDAVCGKRL